MRSWFYAAIGWTLLILGLCWMPRSVVAKAGGEQSIRIPHVDKIAHTGMFAGFAFLWLMTFPRPRRFTPLILAGLGLAVITELGQMTTWVNRDAGFDDGLFDMIGLALGVLFFHRFTASRTAEEASVAQTEGA